jgi:hypothetical protein
MHIKKMANGKNSKSWKTCAHSCALQLNSVPDIETALTTAYYLGRNGTSNGHDCSVQHVDRSSLQELALWTVLWQWNDVSVFVCNCTKSTMLSLITPISLLIMYVAVVRWADNFNWQTLFGTQLCDSGNSGKCAGCMRKNKFYHYHDTVWALRRVLLEKRCCMT